MRWEFTAKSADLSTLIMRYNGEYFFIVEIEEDKTKDLKQIERIVSMAYLKYEEEFDKKKTTTILRNYSLDSINISEIARQTLALFQ